MGCGSHKSSPPTPRLEETSKPVLRLPDPIPPPPPSPIQLEKTPPKFKPRQLPEKIFEDFIVVWLNPSGDNDPNTQNTEEQLQELVNVVITYTDPDECLDFISHIKDEKIFLVVSGTIVEQFAPRVQDASQIDSIYSLSSQEEVNNIQNDNIPGLAGTFTTVPLLCKQVETAIKICGHNLLKPEVMQSKAERIRFMYDQLFREIILNSEEENMEEVYQFCHEYYSSSKNEQEQEYLNQFRSTYSKKDSIHWYTKEGCLYRALNKALRTREYETLYELRTFIRHLHEEITVRLNKTGWEIPTLYRGQAMETAELDRIRKNIGEPMFFTNFLSTSTNHKTAMRFAEKSLTNPKDKEKVKVLFEIKVDKNVRFPFANIRELSEYRHEEEWLFSMGSIFRIDTIKKQDETELIGLTSINDNDEQLVILKEHFQNFVKDKNVCLNFARLMHQLADWKGSREFYRKSLDKETEYYRQAAIYNNLGSIALELGEYDEALKNYKRSLELEQKVENPDYKDLASTYNNIGTVHHRKKEMDLAIENFERAIAAYNDKPNGDQELIATLYNNIATVLNHQDKCEQALVNNIRCLIIREHILPPLHPSLATAYNSIASTYHYLQFFSQSEEQAFEEDMYAQKAVDYAEKAVNIDNQALPPDHPQTKIHTQNRDFFVSKRTNSKQ